MALPADIAARLNKIIAAFNNDGFDVQTFPDPLEAGHFVNYCLKNGRIGVSATHKCPGPDTVSKYKQAYYVEGDHWTMGWLLGFMAEPAVTRMTTEYRANVIAAYFDLSIAQNTRQGLVQDIQNILLDIVSGIVDTMKPDIPLEFAKEIEGLAQGCHDANPRTQVTVKDLWELNVGVDAILAHLYTGKLFAKAGVSPRVLKVPLYCNAFVAPGDNQRRLFGRDFMFPTANVFQDVACVIIYRPDAENAAARCGFLSQTAPGIIGSLAAVNGKGVAIGVNMSASYLCDPGRPGFNGLLLNRHCMELADSARTAAKLVIEAQRGVSWLYPIADATGDAFIVEAGKRANNGEEFPYFDFIPPYYRRRLPSLQYVEKMREKYRTPAPDHGAVVRALNYNYPTDFITDWNEGLWNAFDRNLFQKLLDLLGDLGSIISTIFTGKLKSLYPLLRKMVMQLVDGVPYSAGYFGERDYVNKTWTDKHCPALFYFAPQRESRADVIVATNHCISPEMRLAAMNDWTAIVGGSSYDDIQWRYDELCSKVLKALDGQPGGLTDASAWAVVNFLSPQGGFPTYYNPDGSRRWQDIQVKGSINLFDLTARKIKSLFGYYGDDPVTITLPGYL